jgi:hypothetical protein
MRIDPTRVFIGVPSWLPRDTRGGDAADAAAASGPAAAHYHPLDHPADDRLVTHAPERADGQDGFPDARNADGTGERGGKL